MTSTTVSRSSTDVDASVARDDVFHELLLTLLDEGKFALDADGIREFRAIIDSTVGDYLVTEQRQSGRDLWQDETFRKFATVNTKKIANAGRERGNDRPSAAQVRDAADEVISKAHDKYCASLPTSRRSTPGTFGPVCALYVKNLGH